MDRLTLQLQHRSVEVTGEATPTGQVELAQGPASALLLTPREIDPTRRYALFTVFHGAGRQDELLAKACRNEPELRQALFLIPRSVDMTWDLISGGEPHDLHFLEYAYDLIYRRYPIDPDQQNLIGYSDGASYALSLGLSNPQLFNAVMVWAAGFVAIDRRGAQEAAASESDRKPRLYLEYGTHDELFPFQTVALPMRRKLEAAGYDLTFSVDEGGRHWPSGSFQREALDWYYRSADEVA